MKCFFKHDWVYQDLTIGEDIRGEKWKYYNRRKCHKCGKFQQNLPSIERTFGKCLMDRWVTIGYSSQKTSKRLEDKNDR